MRLNSPLSRSEAASERQNGMRLSSRTDQLATANAGARAHAKVLSEHPNVPRTHAIELTIIRAPASEPEKFDPRSQCIRTVTRKMRRPQIVLTEPPSVSNASARKQNREHHAPRGRGPHGSMPTLPCIERLFPGNRRPVVDEVQSHLTQNVPHRTRRR